MAVDRARSTLAYTGNGLTCFLVPRWRPEGTRNAIDIQRLKDKLGNRSNASSEVEFRGAWAQLVGEEGRGVAQILEMGTLTRLDCALGTTGLIVVFESDTGLLRAVLELLLFLARNQNAVLSRDVLLERLQGNS